MKKEELTTARIKKMLKEMEELKWCVVLRLRAIKDWTQKHRNCGCQERYYENGKWRGYRCVCGSILLMDADNFLGLEEKNEISKPV